MMTNKKWYKSKTKWGTLLIGVSVVLGTVGGWLSGSIDAGSAFTALMLQVGGILAVFGVRDLPFINKK